MVLANLQRAVLQFCIMFQYDSIPHSMLRTELTTLASFLTHITLFWSDVTTFIRYSHSYP